MQTLFKKLMLKIDSIYEVFGGKTIVFLSVALVTAILTILFSDDWISRIKDKDEEVSLLRNTILNIYQLKSNISNAESAQRGYLITQDINYLNPYDHAIKNAKDNIDRLEAFVKENRSPEQFKNEKPLTDLISSSLDSKITEMDITIKLAQDGKNKEANHIVNMDDGLVQMSKLVNASNGLITIYSQLLNEVIDERKTTTVFSRLAVILGPLFLIFLVVMVIKQLLSELSEKQMLQKQLIELNTQNERKLTEQSKLLSNMALDNQKDIERERRKLARELHDELGSILTATKMDLSWVMKAVKDSHPQVVEKLKKTNEYLNQGINFKRQVVQELHPPMIASFGFWPALKTMVEDTAERNKWDLSFNISDENIQLNETIGLVAYRIIQETLNNCSKYASATKVSVSIDSNDEYLKVDIQDNGIGFDLNNLNQNTHGLSGMRHRVVAIGGKFELQSKLGNGVSTRVMMPLYNITT
jgi:signal transduction histidine kinase